MKTWRAGCSAAANIAGDLGVVPGIASSVSNRAELAAGTGLGACLRLAVGLPDDERDRLWGRSGGPAARVGAGNSGTAGYYFFPVSRRGGGAEVLRCAAGSYLGRERLRCGRHWRSSGMCCDCQVGADEVAVPPTPLTAS